MHWVWSEPVPLWPKDWPTAELGCWAAVMALIVATRVLSFSSFRESSFLRQEKRSSPSSFFSRAP